MHFYGTELSILRGRRVSTHFIHSFTLTCLFRWAVVSMAPAYTGTLTEMGLTMVHNCFLWGDISRTFWRGASAGSRSAVLQVTENGYDVRRSNFTMNKKPESLVNCCGTREIKHFRDLQEEDLSALLWAISQFPTTHGLTTWMQCHKCVR